MHLVGTLDVSRETHDALRHFESALFKWTQKINLISRSTQNDIWSRHIIDSAQMWVLLPKTHTVSCDIGSGGGLPALVLAILAKELSPDTAFSLIESDQRKCVFLRTIIRDLNLSATVLPTRIETAPPQSADVVTARALASLTDLLPLIERHVSPTGTALLMKGKNYADEIEAARAGWHFSLTAHVSQTADDARILELKDIARVAN